MSFSVNEHVLVGYSGNEEMVTVPNGIVKIGSNAFSKSSVVHVVLPDTVKEIGPHAFSGCDNLETINLPEGLEILDKYAFDACKKLQQIKIPSTLSKIPESAFTWCGIKEILIPSNISVIEDQAFAYSALETVILEEGVTAVGKRAFLYCPLKKIDLPKSLQMIGHEGFYSSKFTCDVFIPSIEYWYQIITKPSMLLPNSFNLYANNTIVNHVQIPSGITELCDNLFDGCNSLTDVVLPDGITSINYHCFARCENIHSVYIPESVTKIGCGAFEACKSLTNVIIKGRITKLDERLFCDCKKLGTVSLPECITEIGTQVFSNCENLSVINSPERLEIIGEDAFSYCKSLDRFTFPTGIRQIDYAAFGWAGLTSIELPEGLKSIDLLAFESKTVSSIVFPASLQHAKYDSPYVNRFPGLKKLVIKGKISAFKGKSYDGIDSLKEVYVREDQLGQAIIRFKTCDFFDLNGCPYSVEKMETQSEIQKNHEEKKKAMNKVSSETPVAIDGIQISYPLLQKKFESPILYTNGKPTGFAKPELKEVTVQANKQKIVIHFKIASRLSAIWKKYYLNKDSIVLYDPRVAVEESFHKDPYNHPDSGELVRYPLDHEIPEDTPRLSASEIVSRIEQFVSLVNQCVEEKNLEKIIKTVARKKNGTLYKGRVLHLAFLNVVDIDGATCALVAVNDNDEEITIEIRMNVPVSKSYISQQFILCES